MCLAVRSRYEEAVLRCGAMDTRLAIPSRRHRPRSWHVLLVSLLWLAVVPFGPFGRGATAGAAASPATPGPSASPVSTASVVPTPSPTPTTPSPYVLPWPRGETFTCVQGNFGKFSHQGVQAYAWDFAMPVGSVILAARAGVVRYVFQDSNVGGTDWKDDVSKANYVVIDHGDGTSGLYLHLMFHGALVKVGDQVGQGRPIGYSGDTGFGTGPHLHFMVEKTLPLNWFSQSIPVHFADVAANGGVPVEDSAYTSGNAGAAVTRAPTIVNIANAPASVSPGATPPVGGAEARPLDAKFVQDLTLPDGGSVYGGQTFTKSWQLRNSGARPWPAGTHLVMQGSSQIMVLSTASVDQVERGGSAYVSATLRAPTGSPNSMERDVFRLVGGDGTTFGDELWLRLQIGGDLPTLPAAPRDVAGSNSYFAQIGHNVGDPFLQFFRDDGGVDIFGYPRTEQIQQGGMTVQYFQRARFEYHPELPTGQRVQLTLLGDQLTTDQRPFPPAGPSASTAQHEYFPETRHSVSFGFLRYFSSHGKIATFGYPTSEELRVAGPHGPTTIQYFQRARFEYHPEFAGTPYEVELGLLGDDELTQMGWLPLPPGASAAATTAAASPTPTAVPPPSPTPTPTPTASGNVAEAPSSKASASPSPEHSSSTFTAGQTVTVAALGLRMHSGPSVDSPVIGYLNKGERVRVIGVSSGWAQVTGPSQAQGYVDASYLAAG